MIDNIMKSISEFLGQGADSNSIRQRIMDNMKPAPEPVVQEPVSVKQPMVPDAPNALAPDVMDDLGIHEGDTDETLSDFEPVDVRSDAEIAATRRSRGATVESAIQAVSMGRGTLTRSKSQAGTLYMDQIKKEENPEMKGLTTINGEKRFMMIKSPAEKKEVGQSEYEIGYGIKIMDDWLSDDPNKWMRINNVPVNVKEGLTMDQVDIYLKDRITRDRAFTKAELNGWKDMTEEEKVAWQDLTYNGGIGLLKSDSQAKSAANKGYTMEGLAKLTHFTRAGSNRYRGLLKRRINNYNHAALSVAGAPVIEKYEYGPKGMRIKFSSKLIGDKFSPSFKKKVNDNDGWYDVPGTVTGGKDQTYSVNDDYQFEA